MDEHFTHLGKCVSWYVTFVYSNPVMMPWTTAVSHYSHKMIITNTNRTCMYLNWHKEAFTNAYSTYIHITSSTHFPMIIKI